MTDSINIGEQYNVSGTHNVGKIEHNYGPADVQASLQQLATAVRAIRSQLGDVDRAEVDTSLDTVRRHDSVEPGSVRRALASIAGVATVVGQVGAPVIVAVRQVMAALGV